MQNFELNDAMSNFLSLKQSARLYDVVMTLWNHYNKALDLEVCITKYEELTLDLEGTVEPLLNFLDLKWDNNLLNYQKTALSREVINTPSYTKIVHASKWPMTKVPRIHERSSAPA